MKTDKEGGEIEEIGENDNEKEGEEF